MEFVEDPNISHPFNNIIVLSDPPFCPEDLSADERRANLFTWHRPEPPETETLTAAFCFDYAQYMKKMVANKEKDNGILRKQLYRVNEENYQLVKQLNGYQGKDCKTLYQENRILKGQLDRLSREIRFLRGQRLKGVNRQNHTSKI